MWSGPPPGAARRTGCWDPCSICRSWRSWSFPVAVPAGIEGAGDQPTPRRSSGRLDRRHADRRGTRQGGVLAALALIYTLGYSATAWIIGRRILRTGTPWVVAFLLGWGILRMLAIPIVGGLIWLAALAFGLGALTVTIWRARSTGQATPAPA